MGLLKTIKEVRFMFGLWNKLKGKKTYLLSLGWLIYAIAGAAIGQIDMKTALEMLQISGLGATIRHALDN